VQSASRVDQNHIRLSSLGRNNPVKGNGGRIGPMTLTNNFCTNSIPPHLELINSGSPKCISSNEQRSTTSLCHPLCNLGNGRRFSDTVDSDDQDNKWLWTFAYEVIKGQTGYGFEYTVERSTENVPKPFRSLRINPSRFFVDLLDYTINDPSPKISRKQRGFELFHQLLVRCASKKSIQRLLHDTACFAKPFTESLKPSHRQETLLWRW
jgi:hypothetical protein